MMKSRLFSILIALATLGFGAGCGEEPPPGPPPKVEFRIEVLTTDTDEKPLAKVPVKLDGKVVGFTDKDGVFRGVLTERPDTRISLGVGDIEGYRWMTSPIETTENLEINTAGIGIPVSLQAQAESRKKEYMVWLKVACDDSLKGEYCEGMPVKLNGEEVAKTDAFGYAHFNFEDVPEAVAKVEIDTPQTNPLTDKVSISPEDPTYEIELGLESHVYLVEETFANGLEPEPKKRSVRRSTSRKSSKKRRPKRRPKKTAKKKKKKEKEEAIDLW